MQRGRGLLNQARYRFDLFDQASTSRQWNVAIREAQEALEQAVKAAVLLTGHEHVKGHQAEAVEQLKNLLESQIRLSSSGRPEIAARIQDVCNYYFLTRSDQYLMIMKRVGGAYTQLANCDIPAPNRIIDFEVDGSSLIAKVDDRILTATTDTSLSYGFLARWYFPIKVSIPYWERLFNGARTLGKMREPSFYEKLQYDRIDARKAGEDAQSALALLREAFGVVS